MMTHKEAKTLFRKYRSGKCTPEEIALLESWYIHYARQQGRVMPDERRMEDDLDQIWRDLPVNRRAIFSSPRPTRIVAAIAAAAVLVVGVFSLLRHYLPADDEQQRSVDLPIAANDVGSAEAYIQLDDGQIIPLDSRASGHIYKDRNTVIHKSGGRIAYEPVESRGYTRPSEQAIPYNTVVVPKGRQYELMLSDGSRVWLNSLSSIRFPTRFGREERLVEIDGEAYFEVAHEEDRPFLVRAGDQEVKVLGTHFNINAYADEQAIRTTLLEGKVEVRVPAAHSESGPVARILQPGQQSRFSSDVGKLNVVAVDVKNAIAWKSGLILFEGATIESILRQVSRWYDVEVAYIGVPSDRRFTGGVSRNAPFSEFLRVLELNEIRFTYDDHTLRIYNMK